jgi:hypothetical protein
LQRLQAALQAYGLTDDQAGLAGNRYHDVDELFFCCTKV